MKNTEDMRKYNKLFWRRGQSKVMPDAYQHDKGQVLFLPELEQPDDAAEGGLYRVELSGSDGIARFVRNMLYDGAPHILLPDELFSEPGKVQLYLVHACEKVSNTLEAATLEIKERPPVEPIREPED